MKCLYGPEIGLKMAKKKKRGAHHCEPRSNPMVINPRCKDKKTLRVSQRARPKTNKPMKV
jgi:hypothetical protein